MKKITYTAFENIPGVDDNTIETTVNEYNSLLEAATANETICGINVIAVVYGKVWNICNINKRVQGAAMDDGAIRVFDSVFAWEMPDATIID